MLLITFLCVSSTVLTTLNGAYQYIHLHLHIQQTTNFLVTRVYHLSLPYKYTCTYTYVYICTLGSQSVSILGSTSHLKID